MNISFVILGAVLILPGLGGSGVAAVLSTGTGDGTLSVVVDPGGNAPTALYDPLGARDVGDVMFESFLALGTPGGAFVPLDAAASGVVTEDAGLPDQTVSTFMLGGLSATLQQIVRPIGGASGPAGAVLEQNLLLVNTGSSTAIFSLRRYADPDLMFDGSLLDGGGRGVGADPQLLHVLEADEMGSDPAQAATLVGITARGGTDPATGAWAVGAFDALKTTVLTGGTLAGSVAGDTSKDGQTDTPYDVTLALQSDFVLAPGAGATWQTTTLFGAPLPQDPGASAGQALIADDLTIAAGGTTETWALDAAPAAGTQIYLEASGAEGYRFGVTGARFASFTAPSLFDVPDPDGYLLTVHGQSYQIAPGARLDFGDLGPVLPDRFELSGVNPQAPAAFVSAVTLDAEGSGVTLTQASLTPVPLPGSALLLGGALGIAGMAQRVRRGARGLRAV